MILFTDLQSIIQSLKHQKIKAFDNLAEAISLESTVLTVISDRGNEEGDSLAKERGRIRQIDKSTTYKEIKNGWTKKENR